MYSIYRFTLSSPGQQDQHYVGCTARPQARKREHRSKLLHGKHPNKQMQAAYDSGASASFAVIDTAITKSEGEALETSWTNTLRSQGAAVFNRRVEAGSNAGFLHAAETKAQISAALAGRNTRSPEAIAATNSKLRGMTKPAHVIAAIQAAHKVWRSNPKNVEAVSRSQAKLSDADVVAVRASEKTYKQIAIEFSTTASTVCLIKQRKRYAWVP